MASLTLRFAARDNWDEVIEASVHPNTAAVGPPGLIAVENASGWGRAMTSMKVLMAGDVGSGNWHRPSHPAGVSPAREALRASAGARE